MYIRAIAIVFFIFWFSQQILCPCVVHPLRFYLFNIALFPGRSLMVFLLRAHYL